MTNEEIIAIVQAAEYGEQIQYLKEGEWSDTSAPLWNFHQMKYRVKPEPPHCYGRISETGHIGPVVHATIEEAQKAQHACWGPDDSIIKFRAAPDEEQPFL